MTYASEQREEKEVIVDYFDFMYGYNIVVKAVENNAGSVLDIMLESLAYEAGQAILVRATSERRYAAKGVLAAIAVYEQTRQPLIPMR